VPALSATLVRPHIRVSGHQTVFDGCFIEAASQPRIVTLHACLMHAPVRQTAASSKRRWFLYMRMLALSIHYILAYTSQA
jgi:hypothetical protein